MAPGKAGGLGLRIVSSLVLIPLVLAAVWFGPPYLTLLIALLAAGMGWEWARLAGETSRLVVFCTVATPLGAVALAAAGFLLPALGLALLGGAVAGLVARRLRQKAPLWIAAGTWWVALPCVVFLWLAAEPGVGRPAILWLLALVWATDIGAYAAGRTIGGPRLAPRLSPNKTWAGFAGGLLCAALVGLAAARLEGAAVAAIVPVSVFLAVVAQLGDLAESLAKRHFGVKDSGSLIPGHGGLLDRLDSVLTAVAAQGLLTLLAGVSPLLWRA